MDLRQAQKNRAVGSSACWRLVPGLLLMLGPGTPTHAEGPSKTGCFHIEGGLDIRGEEKRVSVCQREIDRLWKAPFSQDLRTERDDAEVEVSNCADYIDKIGYGNYWQSRSEQADEVPYMRTCSLLLALRIAGNGRNAYRATSDALNLAVLPPTLVFSAVTDDRYDELARFAADDESAKDLGAAGRLTDANELSIDTTSESTSIRVIAIADVDGDGTNDYIVERRWSCFKDCSDSAYHVGYLSPKSGRRTMTWVAFSRELLGQFSARKESVSLLPAE